MTSLLLALPGGALAQPALLVETGAAVPVASARSAFGPGGYLALGAGQRFDLFPGVSLGLLGAATTTIFDYECGSRAKSCTDDKTATVVSFTAGPRLALHDGGFELFFGARGGHYRGITGGRSGNAGGFAIEAGMQYELVPGTTAGILIRREEASLRPTTDNRDIQLLHAGFVFEHRFAAAPRAVSHPRHRPEF